MVGAVEKIESIELRLKHISENLVNAVRIRSTIVAEKNEGIKLLVKANNFSVFLDDLSSEERKAVRSKGMQLLKNCIVKEQEFLDLMKQSLPETLTFLEGIQNEKHRLKISSELNNTLEKICEIYYLLNSYIDTISKRFELEKECLAKDTYYNEKLVALWDREQSLDKSLWNKINNSKWKILQNSLNKTGHAALGLLSGAVVTTSASYVMLLMASAGIDVSNFINNSYHTLSPFQQASNEEIRSITYIILGAASIFIIIGSLIGAFELIKIYEKKILDSQMQSLKNLKTLETTRKTFF